MSEDFPKAMLVHPSENEYNSEGFFLFPNMARIDEAYKGALDELKWLQRCEPVANIKNEELDIVLRVVEPQLHLLRTAGTLTQDKEDEIIVRSVQQRVRSLREAGDVTDEKFVDIRHQIADYRQEKQIQRAKDLLQRLEQHEAAYTKLQVGEESQFDWRPVHTLVDEIFDFFRACVSRYFGRPDPPSMENPSLNYWKYLLLRAEYIALSARLYLRLPAPNIGKFPYIKIDDFLRAQPGAIWTVSEANKARFDAIWQSLEPEFESLRAAGTFCFHTRMEALSNAIKKLVKEVVGEPYRSEEKSSLYQVAIQQTERAVQDNTFLLEQLEKHEIALAKFVADGNSEYDYKIDTPIACEFKGLWDEIGKEGDHPDFLPCTPSKLNALKQVVLCTRCDEVALLERMKRDVMTDRFLIINSRETDEV